MVFDLLLSKGNVCLPIKQEEEQVKYSKKMEEQEEQKDEEESIDYTHLYKSV